MSENRKILTTFDKILLAGTGCGVIGICSLGVVFYYMVVNPPNQSPTPIPTFSLETSIAPTIDVSTQIASPTLELGVLPATSIPTPVPNFGNNAPPVGKIVFTCYVNKIDQICLMNADGTNREQLTDMDATAFYASLSPDGQKVYFSSRRSSGFEIHSLDFNGNVLQRLTRNIGSLYAPELSPNGDWVIFTNNGNGLWLMKPDGKNPHALTSADDIDPTWSPDGSMIAFASSRVGPRQLFVMNADGTNVRQVTNLPDMGGRSSWSPDGTKLAFYAGVAPNHNIYVINIDGTGLVQLTDGGDNLGPSWSPDGNWIAFASFRDGNNEIYIIHPDGTSPTRLTNSPISDWQPRWGR